MRVAERLDEWLLAGMNEDTNQRVMGFKGQQSTFQPLPLVTLIRPQEGSLLQESDQCQEPARRP